MQKVMLVAGGIIAGFVLAVVLSRTLLANNGDTTIKLAESAPAIPSSMTESAPLAGKDAPASPAEPQTAPAGSTQTGPATGSS